MGNRPTQSQRGRYHQREVTLRENGEGRSEKKNERI